MHLEHVCRRNGVWVETLRLLKGGETILTVIIQMICGIMAILAAATPVNGHRHPDLVHSLEFWTAGFRHTEPNKAR